MSSDEAMEIIPYRETLPYVGLSPTIPQNDAGSLVDPHVSVPVAARHRFAASAAADPLEDPPATFLRFQGFFVGL